MKIVLYSTNCPRCKVLEQKLLDKGIAFGVSNDVDAMIGKGFSSAPVLEVDGHAMGFMAAVDWVNNRKAEK